jgi:Cu(I)/Ag(I) efflux system membrane fusion protein
MAQENSDASNLLLGRPGGKIWVYIDVYDYEANLVKPGHMVDLTSPALPGRHFQGPVRAVDSVLNSDTRTLRVRAEVLNSDGALRPEMFLNAAIRADIGRKLAIPETAVIDTGTRKLVFVERTQGQYDPREIQTGQEADGFVEVTSGLKEGEKVVTSANFLIDSESKIKAAAQGL